MSSVFRLPSGDPGHTGSVPTNPGPEFKKVQAEFRRAREPEERLRLLREMLAVLPKHKGTEHLQADIKSKVKELTEELSGPKKGGARGGPPTAFRPEGAAQVALIGPPNSGKSALHDRMTGSHSPAEPYAFATQYPQPGMFPFEDVAFQMIDVPSVATQHPIPWLANTLQPADAALLVVDVSEPGCVEAAADVIALLAERKVVLDAEWPNGTEDPGGDDDDPFSKQLPTLLLGNKADLLDDPLAELSVLKELEGWSFPTAAVSASTGQGLEDLGAWLFERLGVVRVYTKLPGKDPDLTAPFTIRRGQTVLDLATDIHKDVARALRFARVWGSHAFDGQQVGRDYQPHDGDVIELH